MNTGIRATLFTSMLLLIAAGCSTPPAPLVEVLPVAVDLAAPPQLPRHITPEGEYVPRRQEDVVGRVCQLGTSCLTMDSRPFEVCLLGAKNCSDKVREPLLVDNPEAEPR
jgi:hypothetical protein